MMDMAVHLGVLRHVRQDVNAVRWVPITAILLDAVILAAFLWMKAISDQLVIWVALVAITFIVAGERLFLSWEDEDHAMQTDAPG